MYPNRHNIYNLIWMWCFFMCRNTPMSKVSIVDYNPTEEQRKKNHYLSLGVQTMYIMADVHPDSRYTINVLPVIVACHCIYRPCVSCHMSIQTPGTPSYLSFSPVTGYTDHVHHGMCTTRLQVHHLTCHFHMSLGIQTMYIMACVHPDSRYTILPVIFTCHWVYRPCTSWHVSIQTPGTPSYL